MVYLHSHRCRALALWGSVVVVCLGRAPLLLAGVVHVPGDQVTLQAGINATSNGDTVLATGIAYTGPGNRNLNFGGRAIVVRSASGPASCTIDAENADRVFAFTNGETSAARLEGFTITRGLHSTAGGGIYIANSSPTISNCVITNNRTGNGAPGTSGVPGGNGGSGAGVYVTGGSPLLVDCTVSANRTGDGGAGFFDASGSNGSPGGNGGAGAGLYVGPSAHATLLRCRITGNVSGTGGMGGSSVVCVQFNCQTFGENGGDGGDGGGIYVQSTVDAINSVFAANQTGTGGAAGTGPGLPLPTAGRGGNGAAWNGGTSSSKVANCVLYGNLAAGLGPAGQLPGTGGGIEGTPTVTNSILWANNSTQASPLAPVTFSDVQGGFPGSGNIALDPQFKSAASGNFHLQQISPCIDAGSNAAVPAGTATDLDLHTRIVDGNGVTGAIVDMGPFEFDPNRTSGVVDTAPSLGLAAVVESSGDRSVRILYRIGPESADVNLAVYDIRGRRVRALDRGAQPPGDHLQRWDTRDESGERVVRGVYFVRLLTAGKQAVDKIVLMR
jgi:hypothetical protein